MGIKFCFKQKVAQPTNFFNFKPAFDEYDPFNRIPVCNLRGRILKNEWRFFNWQHKKYQNWREKKTEKWKWDNPW